MKKPMRVLLVTATALSLLLSSQITAYAKNDKNNINRIEHTQQVQQKVNFAQQQQPNSDVKKPSLPPQASQQAQQHKSDVQKPSLPPQASQQAQQHKSDVQKPSLPPQASQQAQQRRSDVKKPSLPPQASEQAQEHARRVREEVRQKGLVAPDIRHEGPPESSRDTSLASTTYNGITISLYDSKVSEGTLTYIVSALENTPDLLLDKFSGTIYVVSDIQNIAATASADAIGMFVTRGDIYIEEWRDHEDTYLRTLAHELGHNLDWKLGLSAGYSTFLSTSDTNWVALWRDYPTYQSKEGSLYSTVSIQEWFAEIIADYVCYPDYEEDYYPVIYDAVDALFNI